ncbi:MAG: prepilin-type N-terminal cleavage/methylation domain-containing protein [Candidatus Deferrimicrobiaceae bacterium]
MRAVKRAAGPGARSAKGGFTLLEVVVALTIFAVGILAIIELFSGSLRLSEGARDVSAAQVYASQRIEEALLAPDPVPGVESGAFGEKYRWEMMTTQEPTEEESPYREMRIQVIIRWDDGEQERSVDLSASRWERIQPDEKG